MPYLTDPVKPGLFYKRLCHSLALSVSHPLWKYLQNTVPPKPCKQTFWNNVHPLTNVTCHMSWVTCHMSWVTCPVSHVTCHMSCVTSHLKYIFQFIYFFSSSFDKVVKIVGGGSVINAAYPFNLFLLPYFHNISVEQQFYLKVKA